MRLPWRRDNQHQSDMLAEDKTARRDAEQQLSEAREQWPEVFRLAAELRRQRRSNRFSERIMHAIKGGEP